MTDGSRFFTLAFLAGGGTCITTGVLQDRGRVQKGRSQKYSGSPFTLGIINDLITDHPEQERLWKVHSVLQAEKKLCLGAVTSSSRVFVSRTRSAKRGTTPNKTAAALTGLSGYARSRWQTYRLLKKNVHINYTTRPKSVPHLCMSSVQGAECERVIVSYGRCQYDRNLWLR